MSTASDLDPLKHPPNILLKVLLAVFGVRSSVPQPLSKIRFEPTPSTSGYAINRAEALSLISEGSVRVDGEPCLKFDFPVYSLSLLSAEDANNKDDVAVNAHISSSSSSSSCSTISIDHAALRALRSRVRLWMLNKPAGIDCNMNASDPSSLLHLIDKEVQSRESQQQSHSQSQSCCVAQAAAAATQNQQQQETEARSSDQQQRRPFPVGRLDKESTGLLLLTNSGTLCERALHPDFVHKKRYLVRIARKASLVPAEFWAAMRAGVKLTPEGVTPMCEVTPVAAAPAFSAERPDLDGTNTEKEDGGGALFHITLTTGWNKQIRRMCEAVGQSLRHKESKLQSGYYVVSLQRVEFGPIVLREELCREGAVVELTGDERESFLDYAFKNADHPHHVLFQPSAPALRPRENVDNVDGR